MAEVNTYNPVGEEHEEKKTTSNNVESSTSPTPEPPKEEKSSFLDGIPKKSFSLDDHLTNLKSEPKQDYIKEEEEQGYNSQEEDFEDEMEEDLEEEFFQEKTNKNAKKNARNITRWFDSIFAFVLNFWSGADDFTLFKADKKGLSVIEESLTAVFEQMPKDINISGGLGLIAEVPIVYFPKIQTAIRIRKAKKAEAKRPKGPKKMDRNSEGANYTPPEDNNGSSVTDITDFEEISLNKVVKNGNGKTCKVCSKPLKGRQKSTCSNSCKGIHLKRLNNK